MTAHERDVYYYLKARRNEFIPLREISRRTGGKRRYRYNPDWVRPVLASMTERGILEHDGDQGYRLKPIPRKNMDGKRWVSPEIAKILKDSGKGFKNVMTVEDEDEYYNSL
jgi:hypothetical protein